MSAWLAIARGRAVGTQRTWEATEPLVLLVETAAILNADIVTLQETRRAAAAGPIFLVRHS